MSSRGEANSNLSHSRDTQMRLHWQLEPSVVADIPAQMVLADVTFASSPVKESLLVDTFKGFHRNRVVCVRKLRYYEYNGEDLLAELIERAKVYHSLENPRLLTIYGFHQRGNAWHLVLPWEESHNMIEYQRICGPSNTRICYILHEVAEGLHFLHSNGVAHRNVKPNNVFVRQNGEVKIALEPAMNTNPRAPEKAKERSFHRLAPEVNRDNKVTSKSDVYAMGHLMVEAYTLEPPSYPSEQAPWSLALSGAFIPNEKPSYERCHGRHFPPALWELVHRCWHDDENQRPTMAEVRLTLLPVVES